MKFHLDADQSGRVAVTARSLYAIDISSSNELGMNGFSDEEQLMFATQQGRCIVTRNGPHFIRLTRQFMAAQLPHAGVLIVPASMQNYEFARLARAITWFHRQYPAGAPPYFVGFLEDPPEEERG